MQIGMNIGFITNSSSVVHHIPKALFEHPKMQAFLQAYGGEGGFVGDEIWNRSQCGTLAITQEQKSELKHQFESNGYGSPVTVDPNNESEVILVYGDEYEDLAYMIHQMLRQVSEEVGQPLGYGWEYN